MILRYKVLIVGNAIYDPNLHQIPENTGDCTITLVYAYENPDTPEPLPGSVLLIDPGFGHYKGVTKEIASKKWLEICAALQELSLTPKDISWLFITHNHLDHVLLKNQFTELGARLLEKSEGLFSSLEIVSTPGHSFDSKTIFFPDGKGQKIAITGDAIINESYFRLNQVYLANGYTKREIALTRRSMNMIANLADIIIPGHGPAFRVAP